MSDSSASAWAIRPYLPGDEVRLVDLFSTCFGKQISEGHWRWKLRSLPAPVETVWLAVAGDRIVGQYSGIPVRFWLEGKECLAMVNVDAMVHPEFRRQGILTSLVRRAHAHWREAGAAFNLGLPNANWGSRTDALGWLPIFDFQWKILPRNLEALLARRLRLPVPDNPGPLSGIWNRLWTGHLQADDSVQMTGVRHAGPEFDRLWEVFRKRVKMSIVRDATWVNWRYLRSPSVVYDLLLAERDGEPVGYVAYRLRNSRRTRQALLVDFFTDPDDSLLQQAILRSVTHYMERQGADVVISLAAPGSALDRMLNRAGFWPIWGAFDLRMALLDPGLPLEKMRDPGNWLLCGGDFDVV